MPIDTIEYLDGLAAGGKLFSFLSKLKYDQPNPNRRVIQFFIEIFLDSKLTMERFTTKYKATHFESLQLSLAGRICRSLYEMLKFRNNFEGLSIDYVISKLLSHSKKHLRRKKNKKLKPAARLVPNYVVNMVLSQLEENLLEISNTNISYSCHLTSLLEFAEEDGNHKGNGSSSKNGENSAVELTSDHVFHCGCIEQSFVGKSACPSCGRTAYVALRLLQKAKSAYLLPTYWMPPGVVGWINLARKTR